MSDTKNNYCQVCYKSYASTLSLKRHKNTPTHIRKSIRKSMNVINPPGGLMVDNSEYNENNNSIIL